MEALIIRFVKDHLAPILPLIQLGAVILGILGLIIAWMNFRRKSSVEISVTYQIAKNHECNDSYVSEVLLHNKKDKAEVIYAIYLKLGRNNFIKLISKQEFPLVIKPFEIQKIYFDKIGFYTSNCSRINIAHEDFLFESASIVLSTSRGKYIAKKILSIWDPKIESLIGTVTSVIQPVYFSYRNEYFGETVLYLLVLTSDTKERVIPIYSSNNGIYLSYSFAFDFTNEAMESKSTLESFLQEQFEAGKLHSKFEVIDFGQHIESVKASIYKQEIPIRYLSFFKYHLFSSLSIVVRFFKTWLYRISKIKRVFTKPL